MKSILVLTSLLLSLSSFAAGGFTCADTSSGDLTFEIGGVTSHGFMSAMVSMDAVLKLLPVDGAPTKQNYVFDKSNVSQYWNSGADFRLALYSESEKGPHSWISIELKTSSTDEIEFTGKYDIHYGYVAADGKTHTGSYTDRDITCEIE